MRRLKRQPTENLATTELRNAILTGSLAPGTWLRQEELAERFGVSRMPVRQALLALEREGLVKTDPYRGAIVALLDPDTIRDMYTVRSILERHVARALAERGNFEGSVLHEVIGAGRQATAKGDLQRLIELDLKFHTHLYEAFGNRVLLDVMRGHWTHIRRLMAMTLTLAEYRRRVWEEHAGILKAIEVGDVEGAGELAESHTTGAAITVIEHLEPVPAAAAPNSRRAPRRA
jgi:DNA-binding GntR family transcriptional regulator